MSKQNKEGATFIPTSLKMWFIIHLVIDTIFAIPLIFFPNWILNLFEIPTGESVMARIVGASLVGISSASFLTRNKTKESYDVLLTLKLIWSSTAILGLLLSLFFGAPQSVWLIIGIFTIFFFIWLSYKKTL